MQSERQEEPQGSPRTTSSSVEMDDARQGKGQEQRLRKLEREACVQLSGACSTKLRRLDFIPGSVGGTAESFKLSSNMI